MGTNPNTLPENVGRVTAPDANYTYGSAKDDTTGVAGDGTPLKKAWANDIYGFFQWLYTQASIVPSGNAETILASDLGDSLRRLTVLPYVATLDYLVNGYARGSDGNLYQCLVANGPGSTVVDPTVDIVGFWVLATPKNPRDNLFINGDFQVAQRGGPFPTVIDGEYTLDHWRYTKSGVVEHTISQNAVIPTQAEADDTAGFSLTMAPTTVDAVISAGDFVAIGQPVEGFNIKHLLNRKITLSFWVLGKKTGVHCVAFRNSGLDRSYVVEYTIDSSLIWEKKSVTITLHDGVTGTWDFTNGIGLAVDFILAAGSTFHAAPDVWQTGNFLATANQVNEVDSTGNRFRLALVKLEAGDGPTAFSHRSFGEELALCQRYYEEIDWSSAAVNQAYLAYSTSTTNALIGISFKEKRTPPSITATDIANWDADTPSGVVVLDTLTFDTIHNHNARMLLTKVLGFTVDEIAVLRAKAAADARIFIEAEL